MSHDQATAAPDQARFRTTNRRYARRLYQTHNVEQLEESDRYAIGAGAFPMF